MAPVETVAVLALAYREAWRNRHSGAISVEEDMEVCREEISLLAMVASQALQPEDWAIIAIMDEHYSPLAIGRELADWSAPRCEALLHAWPDDPREELASADWAEPFLARWELVEATMAGLHPLTWSRERQEEVAARI
jgi:hypothetical protein